MKITLLKIISILVMSLMIINCLLLLGCATHQSQPTLPSCAQSKFLMTNLEEGAENRQYLLPNGQPCVNN